MTELSLGVSSCGSEMSIDNKAEGLRVIVLGVDGLTPGLVRRWAAAGYLPNFERLIAEGCFGKLLSTGEFSSPQAWPSFMTGVNPGKHGIFSFLQRVPRTYQFHHTTSQDIKAETVFSIISRHNHKVAALNFPCTYPAQPVNGIVIGGWLTPSLRANGATYPASLAEQIRTHFGNYPFHAEAKRHVIAGNNRRALANLTNAVNTKVNIAAHLYDQQPWDLFAVAIVETDAAQHYFWPYCDPQHPLYEQVDRSWCQAPVRRLYEQVDAALGEIMHKIDERTVLMVMSDHGGAILNEGRAYVRSLLEESGLTVVKPPGLSGWLLGGMRRYLEKLGHRWLPKWAKSSLLSNPIARRWVENYFAKSFISHNDWRRTRAYCFYWETQPWVNLAGREPQGIVQPGEEYEQVRDYMIQTLLRSKDPASGQPAVDEVFRREELYHGPYLENFPDIAIWWNCSVALSGLVVADEQEAMVQANKEMDMTGLYGGHSPEGTIALWGPGINKGQTLQEARIEDLAPTILYVLGHPVPEYMDGAPLLKAMTEEITQRPVKYEEGSYQMGASELEVYTDEEEEAVRERLSDLGYI